MDYACTTHGIHLYHAWNTPVSRMEYACITHGICLYHAWNMPVSCLEYACTMHGIHLEHAGFMHEISIFFMHGTCMKFRHQSMHVTCMSHT